MKENLLFSNTCGKIYHDSAIFAFEHKEKTVLMEDIRKVKTEIGITIKSAITIVLPLSMLGFIYLIRNMELGLRIMIIFLTILFTVAALYNAEKTFHLILTMKDGSRLKIRISENNKKDTEKFVFNLNKQLKK